MQTASYSITSFGHDAPRVRELLIQIALSDLSPSSTAVLKSALALASFHRENPLQATAQYKVAALRKLAESTQGRISVTDSACHIAAGMILSTLEIQQNSMKSSHWLWYACGAAKIVKTAGLDVDNLGHDTAALVGWVHYYNTLSRFSLRHWQPHVTLDADGAADSFHPVVCGNGQPESLTGAPHEILYLLSEAFNAVTVPSDPRYETKAHRSHLEILDWKLRNLEKIVPDNNASADTTHPAFDLVVELYRLSTLIYLRRASAGILPLDQKFTTWVGQAFELLEQLPACQWPFPLLIFGCEAESDRQRMIVLEVMDRTTENMQYRNIATVKRVVETVWVQKDLYTEDMNYVRKLGVILSSTHKSFEFVRQLSADSSNTVIGFVRNKKATEEKIQRELSGRSNIHTIQGEIQNLESVKNLVKEVAKITGGSLDYIIANAALQSEWSAHNPIGVLGEEPERLEEDMLESFKINTLGNIHLFNLALPLIRKGQAKKIIAISSGMADPEFITNFSITDGAPYTISKGALNIAVAKFDAQYRKEGILFMAVSPGLVATQDTSNYTEEQLQGVRDMVAAFKGYAPDWEGAISPEESATAVLSVINKASIEAGNGGSFVSHYGNKQWL
ncbi:Short-chain dehydrogenase/reductase SDR [Fusarium oxysporum f. sp. vasinfectum]|nr:Short-chain dehydrogenase/reductase SDR [Fusarium oxysporum f. sp. vasinfectum]